jgi:DNA-directed RNA polymerase alpha subunit
MNNAKSKADYLKKYLKNFDLSIRTKNIFSNYKIVTVLDLIQKSQKDLFAYPNFGRKCFNEIKSIILKPYNLSLGTKNYNMTSSENIPANNKILTRGLNEFDFSIRTKNVFDNNKLYFVFELLKKTEYDLLSYPNFGKNCLDEIYNILLIPNNLLLGSINDSFRIEKDVDILNENIYLKLNVFELSKRTMNILKDENISLVIDLVKLDNQVVSNLPNLGKTSFNEIQNKILKPLNIYLGYQCNENLNQNEIKIKSNKVTKKYLDNMTLENPIDQLSDREKDVINRRFGNVSKNNPKITETLEEIGSSYKITRERIRQIESMALKKLSYPKNKKYFSDLLKKEHNTVWNLYSKKNSFSLENIDNTSIFIISGDESKYILDIAIEVLFKKKYKFFLKYFKKVNNRNIIYNGFFEITLVENTLNNILKTLLISIFPQFISIVMNENKNAEPNLIYDCLHILKEDNVIDIVDYCIVPKKIKTAYKISAYMTEKLVDLHKFLISKNKNVYSLSEGRLLSNHLDALTSYQTQTRNRFYDLITGFDRLYTQHMFMTFQDQVIPLQYGSIAEQHDTTNKESTEANDIENESSENNDSIITNNYLKFLINEFKINKIIPFKKLLENYANHFSLDIKKSESIFRRLLFMIEHHFIQISPGLFISSEKQDYAFNNKNVFIEEGISLPHFSYIIDAYSYMKLAEADSTFPHATSKYEYAVYNYLKANKSDIADSSYQSFISITNPINWECDENIKEEVIKEKENTFFLNVNSNKKFNSPNNKTDIKAYKLSNIIRFAYIAYFNKGISCFSINKAMGFSLLKYHLSLGALNMMVACGLLEAPSHPYKKYSPINEKIETLMSLFMKDVSLDLEKTKFSYKIIDAYKNIDWNSELGLFLQDEFESNIESFQYEDNWINRLNGKGINEIQY